MIAFPNCKINLGLFVTRKREDGYHDLETVFYPLQNSATAVSYPALKDVLEIVPANEERLHLSGLAVQGDEKNNLVWKAYELMKAAYPGKVAPLDVYLHKAIPMGAGLGGGSADGAFMLSLLNSHCGLGLPKEQLAAYALQLGSDCPFFIYNAPAFASGRGEQLTETTLDLSAYSIQVICPKVHVSTAQAFSRITPRPAPYNLGQLHTLPLADWKQFVFNDFEAPVFAQHPELAAIKDQLYAGGALYASMSGSGSALYGIFPRGNQAAISSTVDFSSYFFV